MIRDHGQEELFGGVPSSGRRLVRVHHDAEVRGIAEDLGIVRGTLRGWLEVYGTGKKTAADGTLTSSPLQSKPPGPSPAVPEGEAPEQRIARLEAENAALRAETTKLTTEREILQRAAKYFAGETRW